MQISTTVFSDQRAVPAVQNRPLFCRSILIFTLVSSNGRHLKSFLYPPHSTFLLLHCWQPGFSSPHFRRFALHVTQPVCTLAISKHFQKKRKGKERKTKSEGGYHCDFWTAWASSQRRRHRGLLLRLRWPFSPPSFSPPYSAVAHVWVAATMGGRGQDSIAKIQRVKE